MGRRRSGCILMALGVVVALVAGGITFFLVLTSTAPKAADAPKRPVLVAAANIPERTLINPSMLRVQQWPQDVVPPGALTTLEDGVNKFNLTPIYAGQAVLGTQIADTKGGSGVAFAIEKGKVLTAVNFGSAAGIVSTGALRAGDTIDLVVTAPGTRGNQVAPTMQNLKIYAIGSVGAGGKSGSAGGGTLFIFQVTPQEALILKYLETMSVDIFLRAAGDEAVVPTEPVTLDYIVNRYRLQRPAAQ